jgi:hypothetical protein
MRTGGMGLRMVQGKNLVGGQPLQNWTASNCMKRRELCFVEERNAETGSDETDYGLDLRQGPRS